MLLCDGNTWLNCIYIYLIYYCSVQKKYVQAKLINYITIWMYIHIYCKYHYCYYFVVFQTWREEKMHYKRKKWLNYILINQVCEGGCILKGWHWIFILKVEFFMLQLLRGKYFRFSFFFDWFEWDVKVQISLVLIYLITELSENYATEWF